ncbi:abortive infection family protein [Pseudomonas syringae]|nr:abortive infection family protein [Pseudomonas syringae]MBX8521362.1 abortive infection family protein [Pseudomonas cichorii]MCK0550941.1 abortive infection family protein [Pseudomonas syringae pv. aptata]
MIITTKWRRCAQMGREMDWKLVEVLRRIEAGDTAFDPADTSKQAFQDFQPLACALVEAHRQGHVDGVMPIKESNGGKLEYRTVIVTGNLTHRGRQLLEKAQGQPTPTDRALNGAFGQLPDPHLRSQWDKALSRRQSDPSGAITAARSFLESTQKWILEQGGISTSDRRTLLLATLKQVGLTDQGTSMSGLLKDIDKLLLSIAQVRNKHGDAHGPSDASSDLTSAEAALCVNVAGALGLFLLECHQAQSKV